MKHDIKKIAYTAGYLDGDGCFYAGINIQKHGSITAYELSIQVVSVKIESLNFFKETFGGFIRKKPDKPDHKVAHCWTIKGFSSTEVAISVKEFLTDKKIQCEFFIELAKTIMFNNFKKIDVNIIRHRDNLITKIREEKHMNDFVTQELIEAIKSIEHISPIDTDFTYLAGLIDSEGCFRIKKWKPKDKPNYVYAINLEIGNTRMPIFEYLTSRFGGNIGFIKAKENKRASALWSISAFALSQIIKRILPYLIVKKPVAEKIIEFYETNLPNGGDRHSEEFKRIYSEKLIERERIVNEIHNLNSKGLKSSSL